MSADEKFLILRNYDLWCHLDDFEYEELNVAHHFIEAKKGDYIYFDSHHLNKLYFVKDGYIKIGYDDEERNESIKEILDGHDLLACAQTWIGETAAFAIPIIQHLMTVEGRPSQYIRALIVTPTRELAIQIDESFAAYGRNTRLKHTVAFGGVTQASQVNALRKGVDILVATPGRLLDLVGQGYIKLDQLTHFVLDEADRMLDMGFVHDVKRIIKLLPAKRQSLFFSATMPDSIRELASSILTQPKKVEVTPVSSTAETIQQAVYFVDQANKYDLLKYKYF